MEPVSTIRRSAHDERAGAGAEAEGLQTVHGARGRLSEHGGVPHKALDREHKRLLDGGVLGEEAGQAGASARPSWHRTSRPDRQ